MTLFQSALLVPVIAIGTTFDSHQVTAAASRFGERSLSMPKRQSSKDQAPKEQTPIQTNFVLQRKARIQEVLLQLDRIAQVTAQMKPETADRVEPVIVDLAEQAIELATEQRLQSNETDSDLTRIETTVGELKKAMRRYVEPEATL